MSVLTKINSILLLFVPMFFGYMFNKFCPAQKQSNDKSIWRPKPIVFQVIWPILYILLGISMVIAYNSKNSSVFLGTMFMFLLISLNSWQYLFWCENKKESALYMIMLSLLFTNFIMINGERSIKLLMSPLLIWLTLALQLNFNEVQFALYNQQQKKIIS